MWRGGSPEMDKILGIMGASSIPVATLRQVFWQVLLEY